jgi:hypothetical protein
MTAFTDKVLFLNGYQSNDYFAFSCLLMCIPRVQCQAGNTMNTLGMGG